ncbi:MAG: trehalose-6-phosphate synthase [Candidatus Zixiibacteriota bacterium]
MKNEPEQSGRFVVVSNRLPIRVSVNDGQWRVEPGSGGLVTALNPVMRRNRGLWIGWPGCGPDVPLDDLLTSFQENNHYEIVPIPLTAEEEQGYYRGFANEVLWPLFHDLLGHCHFDLENYRTYLQVNRRFAETISAHVSDRDFVWVHDYQLIMVGSFLRKLGFTQPLSYFLHTPFPSLDLFRRLPWSTEIIRGLLAYDVLGFQTVRDHQNFVQCVRNLIPNVSTQSTRRYTVLHVGKRAIRAGHFPISIDFDEFDRCARSEDIVRAARDFRDYYKSRQLIVGIDRLDYTKGIPERFSAFERALEKYPDLRGNVSLIQVVVPSRTHVPDYRDLKSQIDRLIGSINGRFSRQGWVPIYYVYRSLDRRSLLALYRACEIGLVTPLRDGMNLIAKEFCACSVDGNGVLILSEFAGAADQMCPNAICVNPYDRESTADAIHAAYTMDMDTRVARMQKLRREIKRNDVHQWLRWVMGFSAGPTTDLSEASQTRLPESVPTSTLIN